VTSLTAKSTRKALSALSSLKQFWMLNGNTNYFQLIDFNSQGEPKLGMIFN